MKRTDLYKLLFLITFVVAGTFEAYSFEVNGIYYRINDGDSTVSVTFRNYDYNSYSGVVTIPQTVTFINKTYSVTSIGLDAFRDCTGLTSVTIPNSVTYIGGAAFYGCTGLTSVTMPNSIKSIGNEAFYGCTGLTSVTISNSVTSVSDYAFQKCTGLTSVTIPNSVTSIGLFAFSDCTGLTNVTISNSVTSIGSSAFYNCRKLKEITIPYPVQSIGSGAFYYCEDLTDVTCLAVTPPSMGSYACIYPAYYMATLHVPEKSVEAYKATEWWNWFIKIVGDASEDSNTPNAPVTDKCDTNDDGEVNIADVNRVIDEILNH